MLETIEIRNKLKIQMKKKIIIKTKYCDSFLTKKKIKTLLKLDLVRR